MNLLLSWLLAHVLAASEPVRMAVMPLAGRSVRDADAEMVTDILAGQMTAKGGSRILERSEMQRILQEQGFQQSGACDGQRCAVEVGRILGIDQMIVGAFGRLGETWVLAVRRVSVETGEVLAQSTRQYDGGLSNVPEMLVRPVVADLSGTGPAKGGDASRLEDADPSSAEAARKHRSVPVRIRVRHDSASEPAWIYREQGPVRTLLGSTPLDTVLMLQQKTFLVATPPREGALPGQTWLVSPSDSADTSWRAVNGERVDKSKTELGRWSTYSSAYLESRQHAIGRLVRAAGIVGMSAGGLVTLISLGQLSSTAQDGSLELKGYDRESAWNTADGGGVVFLVGAVATYIGQRVVNGSEAKQRWIGLTPVQGVGASHTANGLAFSARF